MPLYAFDKRFRDYEQDYGKGAIYDYSQSQLDRFGFSLNSGDILFVVSYLDRSRPVSSRRISVIKFKIARVRHPNARKCGVVFGKRVGKPKVLNRRQFEAEYGFMLNRNKDFKRRSFHQP
jgi:hypothetical protein